MNKYIYLLSFLFSISISSQELFWYDVLLEVEGEDVVEFEKTVDKFYSSVDFPEDVSMTFSTIPLKGMGYEETHILSFVSPSSESLANLRGSLNGRKWENYLEVVRPFIDKVRSSAGVAMMTYNEEQVNPIGQAWCFKIKSKDFPVFSSAFSKLMETFEFPGFIALAQVNHGISNGENVIIYGTYENLNSAFMFGPKNDNEAQAFGEFFNTTGDISEFTQTWTRVKIKEYN